MFSWICKICCASTYHNILLSIFQKSAIMTSKRPWTCLNHGPLQAFHKLFMTWVLPWYLQLDPGLRPWLGGSSSRWKNFGGRMCKQPIPRYPRNHHLSPALGCVARQFLNSSDNSWSKELQLQMWGISYCQRKIHALFCTIQGKWFITFAFFDSPNNMDYLLNLWYTDNLLCCVTWKPPMMPPKLAYPFPLQPAGRMPSMPLDQHWWWSLGIWCASGISEHTEVGWRFFKHD